MGAGLAPLRGWTTLTIVPIRPSLFISLRIVVDPMRILHALWKIFLVLICSCALWALLLVLLLIAFDGNGNDSPVAVCLFIALPFVSIGTCLGLALRGKLSSIRLPGVRFPGGDGVNSTLVSTHKYSASSASVFIARRFVAQAEHIAYYQDVKRAVIRRCATDPNSGLVLDLYTKDGLALSIDQNKFPSNARKAHKIATAQEIKIKKVSEKILKRLTHLQPSQIEGSLLRPLSYQAHIERKHNPLS